LDPFSALSKQGLILYVTNFFGPLTLGDPLLRNTFSSIVGLFNDFTYARFPSWNPYSPLSYFTGLTPHGLGSTFFNIHDASNQITAVTLQNCQFTNIVGHSTSSSSSSYLATVLEYY
jgi:hypothetical protein